jgi:hypothetical protein
MQSNLEANDDPQATGANHANRASHRPGDNPVQRDNVENAAWFEADFRKTGFCRINVDEGRSALASFLCLP